MFLHSGREAFALYLLAIPKGSAFWRVRWQTEVTASELSSLLWLVFHCNEFSDCLNRVHYFLFPGSRAIVMECQYGPRRKGFQPKKAGEQEGTSGQLYKATCPARWELSIKLWLSILWAVTEHWFGVVADTVALSFISLITWGWYLFSRKEEMLSCLTESGWNLIGCLDAK